MMISSSVEKSKKEREPETAESRSALATRPQQKDMSQYWMDRGEKVIDGPAVQLCEGRGLWVDDHGYPGWPSSGLQMSLFALFRRVCAL